MSPGEAEAVNSLLRLLGGFGLVGGAAGLAGGVLRNANPRYNPPAAVPPVVVDVPVPAKEPLRAPVPIVTKTKRLAEAKKAFDAGHWLKTKAEAAGNWLTNLAPTFRHPLGATNAQTVRDLPWYGAATVGVGGLGAVGGWKLGDAVARAVERRRAQKELDDAKREYQDAVNEQTAHIYFPKAAGVADILSGRTPADPVLARVKAALDAAWAVKRAEQTAAPAVDPGRGADQGSKALMSWLWPGLVMGQPGATGQMALLGGLAAAGGLGTYSYLRDDAAKNKIRAMTEQRDRENARQQRAPIIARLVPVPVEPRGR